MAKVTIKYNIINQIINKNTKFLNKIIVKLI